MRRPRGDAISWWFRPGAVTGALPIGIARLGRALPQAEGIPATVFAAGSPRIDALFGDGKRYVDQGVRTALERLALAVGGGRPTSQSEAIVRALFNQLVQEAVRANPNLEVPSFEDVARWGVRSVIQIPPFTVRPATPGPRILRGSNAVRCRVAGNCAIMPSYAVNPLPRYTGAAELAFRSAFRFVPPGAVLLVDEELQAPKGSYAQRIFFQSESYLEVPGIAPPSNQLLRVRYSGPTNDLYGRRYAEPIVGYVDVTQTREPLW